MGHARLKRLTVKAFRSFAEESTIDFPDSGMTLFRGKNLDTGGSSGSGKSSLLLAISYLFGFCKYPATTLQSWLTEEPMSVSAVIDTDAGTLEVTRDPKLSIKFNMTPLKGSAKQLEAELTRLIGLPPDLLAALTYRGQKQPGLFLSKTDSEKKEFLTLLLDLGKFEAAVEASAKKASALEKEVGGAKYVLDQAHQQKKLTENIEPPKVQDAEKLRKDLDIALGVETRLKKQIEDARVDIRTADSDCEKAVKAHRAGYTQREDSLREAIAILESQPVDTSMVDQSRVVSLREDLKHAEGFLQEQLTIDQQRWKDQRQQADGVYAQLMLVEKRLARKPALEKQLIQLGTEIAALSADACDRCHRQWDGAAAELKKKQEEQVSARTELSQLDDLKPQIKELQERYKALGQFEPNPVVEELRGIANGLKSQIAQEQVRIEGAVKLARSQQDLLISNAENELAKFLKTVADGAAAIRNEFREKTLGLHEVLEALENEARVIESSIRGLVAAIGRIEADNAREEARLNAAFDRAVEAECKLAEAERALDEKQRLLNAELDFQRMIGREGFLGTIFDEVLWEISEETNRLLAQFPNTSHVTLNFTSESTTQAGTIKKEITPVVTIGGFTAPLRSGLSGGMETAVELAVDLAVATVVSRRTGAMPGWIILDEAFTGLDTVCAEASLEILSAFARDKLVLVVDHATETKEQFTEFVNVEYKAGASRVV